MGSGSCIKWIHIMPIKISKTRIDIGGLNLTGLREPLTSTEAATKNYADTHTPRVVSVTTATSLTPNFDTTDVCIVTALASHVQILAPTGTGSPDDGQRLVIRVKDNGTLKTMFWTLTSGGYRSGTQLPLPYISTATKTLYMAFIYNSADSKWDLVAVLNGFT